MGCWNIRNVKLKSFSFFPEMPLYFLMFITAVSFLFLLKLRRPKNKSIYMILLRILGLQSLDKAAMLGSIQQNFFSKNLHENRV